MLSKACTDGGLVYGAKERILNNIAMIYECDYRRGMDL
jgi:hypothetical protein